MIMSAPLYRLKREAKLLSRSEKTPLHVALDRVAVREGFQSWSLLAARTAAPLSAGGVLARLAPGDLVLVGARPGQGKTLLSLGLAVEAMKQGRRAAFFSLEYNRKDIVGRFRAIGAEPACFEQLFSFDDSDAICAEHIIASLDDAPRGTLVVIDYLQLLDQRRANPDLATQMHALKRFARDNGMIFAFISQVDRSYDPEKKTCPDLGDVRLPNPLDLSLFSKACFLHAGAIRFHALN
ncbi:MAG: DNA helicase [Rhizobiales bacterium 65-9]|nr:AAA family ATPase [Hyphomicrobiales bacterium]OJY34687.1 MAG: DNA helicase [Rhizobiales bacterium 65-9]